MMLIKRLTGAAEIWGRENSRSLSRLATVVVNDGKLFDRLAAGGSCTVATYERLMAHLRDPQNWANPIPLAAEELLGLHDDNGKMSALDPSSGKADAISAEAVAS